MIYEIKAELLEKQIEKLKELNHILSEMASYASCITNPHMLTLREERKKLESELAALESQQEQSPDLKELKKRLDDSLAKETKESLNKFLDQQEQEEQSKGVGRIMSNPKECGYRSRNPYFIDDTFS
jgi:flagellar biosynthesis component FlhA